MPYIFGYGSLIWKADFPYTSKQFGWVEGYVRRFWNSSTDHRGTVDNPGRVVTMIPIDEWKVKYSHLDPHPATGRVYGIVYEISDQDYEYVLKHLDLREKDGYDSYSVSINLVNGGNCSCTVYLATSSSSSFAGPASIEAIAAQINSSAGFSGSNGEYLFNLVKSVNEIGIENCLHLNDLFQFLKGPPFE